MSWCSQSYTKRETPSAGAVDELGKLMNPTSMAVILDAAAFLELTGDDVLDPDVAVAQLEDMVADLQKRPAAERAQLVAFARTSAASERDPARRDFFTSFADSIQAGESTS